MLVYLFLCFHLASDLLVPAYSRRYDVEVESIRLFGESLQAVLARFRRTPEYLEILKTHLEDLIKEREETAHHLVINHRNLLKKRVNDMFGVNSTRRRFSEWESRRRFGHRHGYRRDAAHTTNSSDMEEAIEDLDNYHLLRSPLTVEERNRFKDLGFEVAGDIIHSLIRNLNPNDAPMQSTRQPWGSGKRNVTNTTEHSHVVTRQSTLTIYANALNATTPAKSHKQRMRQF